MNKCKWKDGVFKPCDKFDGSIGSISFVNNNDGSFVRCEHCKSNITKPEPPKEVKREITLVMRKYNEGIEAELVIDGKPIAQEATLRAWSYQLNLLPPVVNDIFKGMICELLED